MRILAIRGANLASLTTFEVDLTTDPLAGAGLFAITGDTGAGKSTMLDALCLALYGEYPRAAVGRREDVLDPSGDTLSVQDARNILRRGTASGFAEVDFIGHDGVTYRARWEARRARGKADGKPQKEDRLLSRLDAGAIVEAVASGKTEVLDSVVSKTGLTFDQFRRTVLLAQGEFDAFLLADEKARAELLEKITGTDIYRRISQNVNAATSERQQRIATLDAARGAVSLLEVAQRGALDAEIKASDVSVKAMSAEREALAAKLAVAHKQAEARQRVVEAEQALAAAKATETAAAADRKKLMLYAKLEPVRAKADQSRAATEDHAKSETALKAAEASVRVAQGVVTAAAMALQKAMAAEQAAIAHFTAQEPLWREAESLDTRIAAAKTELAAATASVEKATAEGLKAKATLEKVSAERITIRDTLGRLTADIEATQSHAALAERGREISLILLRRDDAFATSGNASEEAASARKDVERLSDLASIEQRTVSETTTRRESIAESLRSRRAALNASDAGAVEVQDRALAHLQDKVREAEHVAHAWKQADVDILQARDVAAATKATLDRSDEQLLIAESDAERRISARREIGSLADLAEATLSEHAEALRDALVKDQQCPVCGSKSHPFVDHEGGAGTRLVREIAGRRDALDTEIEHLMHQVSELTSTVATAKAQYEDAQRRATVAHAEKTRLAQTYAALAKPLTAAITACRLSHLVPAALDQRTAQALAQIGADAARARSHFEHTLKRKNDLRAEVDTLQKSYDDLARMREAADERLKTIAVDRLEAERRLATADSRAHESLRTLTDLTGQLAPYLGAVGATADDLNRDTRAVETLINERGAVFKARRAERDKLEAKLQSYALDEAAANATHAATGKTIVEAKAVAAEREAQLKDMAAARAALLGGAPTDEHRKAAIEARTDAQSDNVAASADLNKKALAHAVAITLQQSASDAVRDAAARREAARAALAAAVQELGIAWDEVEALMALPANTIVQLSEKIASVARAVSDAQNALELRKADLAALSTDGAVDIDLAATDAQLSGLDTGIKTLRDVAAAARTKLGIDDDARGKVGGMAAEIDAARTDYAVWSAVDQAIGSASGDKFRRFAQGITLDHLVQLANLQLDALNPRYRLKRSGTSDLSLSVIDRDMGDELRAVRSLSGGERFLVSLALALALSGLEGRQSFVDTLFIDEGFGALDAETLDMAIDALEMLQSHGRKVGVITHVAAMIDRITVQVRVEKRGQGRSTVRIANGEAQAA